MLAAVVPFRALALFRRFLVGVRCLRHSPRIVLFLRVRNTPEGVLISLFVGLRLLLLFRLVGIISVPLPPFATAHLRLRGQHQNRYQRHDHPKDSHRSTSAWSPSTKSYQPFPVIQELCLDQRAYPLLEN